MKLKILGISWLFLFAILFYSLRLSVAFFHYAVFNDSFTNLYCVNQDKPEMQCHGQCHLKLETQKNLPDQGNPNQISKELHQSVTLYCEKIIDFKPEKNDLIKIKPLFADLDISISRGFMLPFFQPPDLS